MPDFKNSQAKERKRIISNEQKLLQEKEDLIEENKKLKVELAEQKISIELMNQKFE